MNPGNPAQEPPPRMKRGAFPTPKSEIEDAERFEPEPANADDTAIDDDDTTPGTEPDEPT